MEIEPTDVRSPAELIEEVADRVPLVGGAAYAVLVHDPSGRQRVRAIEELRCGSVIDDYEGARDVIEAVCTKWDDGRWHSPSELKVVTVVVREGLCVWTPVEWAWSNAWRYAATGFSGGDLITVTEHGWYDFMTKHADHQPARVETRVS
ncbi:hypothetical protein [Nocardioides sp.]|uniref:hypothetical protein n=1 Tax=Nocardioides sp. TaxID=35761 RepID=UPI003784E554